MDEPTETQDKSLEELGETSGKLEETSTEETYTKGQLEEAQRKARSDSQAETKRMQKILDTTEVKLNKLVKAQAEDVKRAAEAEEEAAQDQPDKLARIRAQGKLRATEIELAEVRSKLEEKEEQVRQGDAEKAESTKEQNAREVAARLNVDTDRLIRLAKSTDGSTEAIEEIAVDLPKRLEQELNPDSGKSIGGGVPTLETLAKKDINAMSHQEVIEHKEALDKALKKGA